MALMCSNNVFIETLGGACGSCLAVGWSSHTVHFLNISIALGGSNYCRSAHLPTECPLSHSANQKLRNYLHLVPLVTFVQRLE